MPNLDMNSLSLGELQVSSKGAKQVPLSCGDKPLVWQPGPLRVQWQPKAFNDPGASRVAICFVSNETVEAYLQQLDAWVTKVMSGASKNYFGQDLSPQQIAERYTPAVKLSQKGYCHLRAKMNLTGRNAVRCWEAETKVPRKMPDDWTICEVSPCFEIKGVWIMSKDFGLLIEMTDALISESFNVCPF